MTRPVLRRARRLLALAVLLAGAGCRDATGTRPATVTLTNRTALRVEYVFFSQCTDEDWGLDRLGEKEVVAPGASRTWNDLDPGCWDFQAVLEDGREIEDRGVDLPSGGERRWIVEIAP